MIVFVLGCLVHSSDSWRMSSTGLNSHNITSTTHKNHACMGGGGAEPQQHRCFVYEYPLNSNPVWTSWTGVDEFFLSFESHKCLFFLSSLSLPTPSGGPSSVAEHLPET